MHGVVTTQNRRQQLLVTFASLLLVLFDIGAAFAFGYAEQGIEGDQTAVPLSADAQSPLILSWVISSKGVMPRMMGAAADAVYLLTVTDSPVLRPEEEPLPAVPSFPINPEVIPQFVFAIILKI